MIRKQNIVATLMIFLNLLKKFMKNFIPRDNLHHLEEKTDLFFKIPNRKKISNEQFHLCEVKISLKHKHFFQMKPPPILLGVFHSWDKLDTMSVSSRTGVISVIYKKVGEKGATNYRPI